MYNTLHCRESMVVRYSLLLHDRVYTKSHSAIYWVSREKHASNIELMLKISL